MVRPARLNRVALVAVLAGLMALLPTLPALALTDADLHVETVATGLDTIWEMRFLPEGDLLVSERPGRIVKVEIPEGTVVPVGQVATQESGEGGLMGLALDPDYPGRPFIYVAYTYQQGGGIFNRLSRIGFNNTPEIEATQPTFTDVPRSTDPYPFDFIEEAAALGWVQGFGDRIFRPYSDVTRAQLVLMLHRAGELSPPPADLPSPFTDVPPFAAEAVRTAFYHRIVSGRTATTFDPFSPATRGQVARLVFALLEKSARL